MPDLSDVEYTLILPHDAAVELIHGRVRHDVLVACLSAVIAMSADPATSVEQMRQRQPKKRSAA